MFQQKGKHPSNQLHLCRFTYSFIFALFSQISPFHFIEPILLLDFFICHQCIGFIREMQYKYKLSTVALHLYFMKRIKIIIFIKTKIIVDQSKKEMHTHTESKTHEHITLNPPFNHENCLCCVTLFDEFICDPYRNIYKHTLYPTIYIQKKRSY